MKVQIELDVPEIKALDLNPKKTAVVVIDLENEFCSPKGKRFTGKSAIEAAENSARRPRTFREYRSANIYLGWLGKWISCACCGR